jgi:hypothetical protein
VIQGRVESATNQAGIRSATVTLTSPDRQSPLATPTDGAGVFALVQVPAGQYTLSVAAPGFQPRIVRLTVEPREVRYMVLTLLASTVTATVDVTAASASAATHSPSSTVLTTERLTAMAPAQRINLPDALVTLAPGMIRGHDDFVHIRGTEVALNPMINGVFFWENPHSLFSSGLSPQIIETANVMTGGFPAEYGNRFGGVVDAVTKSGFRMRERGSFTIDGGGAGRHGVTGEVGGQRGRLGLYAFGSLFESDRFLSPPDPRAIHDRARGARGFLQVDGDLGDGHTMQAVVMGDGSNFEIPVTPQDVEVRPQALPEQRTRQQTAILNWTHARRQSVVSTSVYQRWSTSTLLPAVGPLTARADLERGLRTFGGKVDVTRIGGRHTIKTGLDAVGLALSEHLAYDYDGYRQLTHLLGLPHIHIIGNAIAFDGRETGSQVSAYVQDDVQLSSRMSANVGVRLDHHRLVVRATHLSPRVNVAIQTGGGTAVHASYNRFFVPPPIEGALSTSAGLTQAIQEIGVALPVLEPTIEDQIEVGVTAGWRALQLGVTAYHRASDSPVHTTVWPDSRIYSYASFDRGRAYGLELRAATPPRDGWSGFLNYALGRVYFFNPVTGGFVTEAAHIDDTSRFLAPMDQTHTATGGLTYHHGRSGFWVGLGAEYGSGTPIGHGASHEHAEGTDDHDHADSGDLGTRVPDHFTADVSLGFNLLRGVVNRARLAVQVNLENVTDDVYLVATEGPFSPRQYATPRVASVTATVKF